MTPPSICSSVEPASAATADSGERSELPVNAGYCARLLALIATLAGPDHEAVWLRVVAGVSIPEVVAALGVTPAALCRAEHQALSALQPAAVADGWPPATRQLVVLLPHAQTEPTTTRSDNRRAGGVHGMNQDDPPRHRTQSNGTSRGIAASAQWHDAELPMKVARYSFDRWLTAGDEDTPSLAIRHGYHTHTALHEAAWVITMLIETFRVEAAASITTPARGTDIPTPASLITPIVEDAPHQDPVIKLEIRWSAPVPGGPVIRRP